MSTIIQYKHDLNLVSLVEHESEKFIPSRITALDMVGLTWILKTEEEVLAEFK